MTETTDPSKEVVWKDPPPRSGPRYDWDAIAAKVRRKPMVWAQVFEHDKSTLPTAIRNGSIRALKPEKGFEVTTADNTRDYPRTCAMWLRYNPDKDVSN
jgi:hypothetical protein